jgi:cell division protein FtsI (penicillin-binding protein 3)
VVGQRVFSPETARTVRKMLQMAAGPGGTAPKAQAIGYSVGGKTGTAHKQEGKGYASTSTAPGSSAWRRSQPAHRGGGDGRRAQQRRVLRRRVAAPVFSQVVQQTLRMMGVPPDLDVKPAHRGQVPAELESF